MPEPRNLGSRREMDMEYVRRHELELIVTNAVKTALELYKHECVLDLDPEQIRQVGNIFSAIKEIGKGDLTAGVETMRENHKLVSLYRNTTGKIGTVVITTIIVALVGVTGSSLVIGFVEKIKAVIK